MKKLLQACSLLLALSLVLFGCKSPSGDEDNVTIPKYETIKVSDLNVPSDVKGTSTPTITKSTPKADLEAIAAAINNETQQYGKLAVEEAAQNDSSLMQAITKMNADKEEFKNKVSSSNPKKDASYSGSIPAKEYALPTSKGSFDVNKYEEKAAVKSDLLQSDTEFSMTMNNSSSTDVDFGIVMTKAPEALISKSLKALGKAYLSTSTSVSTKVTLADVQANNTPDPTINATMQISQAESLLTFFDNKTYAGYFSEVIVVAMNGDKLLTLIVSNIQKGTPLGKNLQIFLDTGVASEDVKNFLEPLLKQYSYSKKYIEFFDKEGNSIMVLIDSEGPITLEEFRDAKEDSVNGRSLL